MFKNVNGKLGNMRKSAQWTLYPQKPDTLDVVIIQSDKRIAQVNMATGKAILSSGKGGHNGFMHLSPALGAVAVDVPPEMVAELRRLTSTNTVGNGIGSVLLFG